VIGVTAFVQQLKMSQERNSWAQTPGKDSDEAGPSTTEGSAVSSMQKAQNILGPAVLLLLGRTIFIDGDVFLRVKRGEKVGTMFAFLCFFFYVLNSLVFDANSLLFLVLLIGSTVAICVCAIMVCYKNLSWFAVKRLMWQLNCAVVFGAGMCIFAIECAVPRTRYTPINAFIYWLLCTLFICLDALKVKSRTFMITVAFIFIGTTLYAIFVRILSSTDEGVVLFDASTFFGVVFYKRQLQRSFFVQTFTFSLSGLYTLFKDKDQKMLIFATGHIYRETGTSSMHVNGDDFQGDREGIELQTPLL
jgi:hypothetical protein|tara:strand:+ start:248 stop:1159 length:912 start_codon:yes stop_codon:yes gene_type:complete